MQYGTYDTLAFTINCINAIALPAKVTTNSFFFLAFQALMGKSDGLDYASLMRLQIFLGLGSILGVLVFGLIIVNNSVQCLISRQYLCQSSCFILAISSLAFTGFNDYSGYVLFSWLYGFFYGGYQYSLKMFIFDKVRARNFNRAWGFLQVSQSLPLLFGMPIISKYSLEILKTGLTLESISFFNHHFGLFFLRQSLRRFLNDADDDGEKRERQLRGLLELDRK